MDGIDKAEWLRRQATCPGLGDMLAALRETRQKADAEAYRARLAWEAKGADMAAAFETAARTFLEAQAGGWLWEHRVPSHLVAELRPIDPNTREHPITFALTSIGLYPIRLTLWYQPESGWTLAPRPWTVYRPRGVMSCARLADAVEIAAEFCDVPF